MRLLLLSELWFMVIPLLSLFSLAQKHLARNLGIHHEIRLKAVPAGRFEWDMKAVAPSKLVGKAITGVAFDLSQSDNGLNWSNLSCLCIHCVRYSSG
jgi:hypothetical protein